MGKAREGVVAKAGVPGEMARAGVVAKAVVPVGRAKEGVVAKAAVPVGRAREGAEAKAGVPGEMARAGAGAQAEGDCRHAGRRGHSAAVSMPGMQLKLYLARCRCCGIGRHAIRSERMPLHSAQRNQQCLTQAAPC